MEESRDAPAASNKSKDWAAADLVKVTEFVDDAENVKEVPSEKLDSLISGPKADEKVVNIRKEDVLLIMDELELPKAIAERKLIEHNGDIISATRDILGFL